MVIDNKVFMLTLRPPPSEGHDPDDPLSATKTFIKPGKNDGIDLRDRAKVRVKTTNAKDVLFDRNRPKQRTTVKGRDKNEEKSKSVTRQARAEMSTTKEKNEDNKGEDLTENAGDKNKDSEDTTLADQDLEGKGIESTKSEGQDLKEESSPKPDSGEQSATKKSAEGKKEDGEDETGKEDTQKPNEDLEEKHSNEGQLI